MNLTKNAPVANRVQINIHKANSRGQADFGWLQARHSFSFGSYFDPKRMGFGALRVLNDDIIAPTRGFDTHPHQDMEIVTIPLRGTLTHKDSMGNSSSIAAGEVQAMSAGTGVSHSEYNLSPTEEVNLLQIWILPEKVGIQPNYDQRRFEPSAREDQFQLIVSSNGADGSVQINQQASFYLFNAISTDQQRFELSGSADDNADRGIYLFVLEGAVELSDELDGRKLKRRDGTEIRGTGGITFTPELGTELLLIEVPLS